MSNDNNDNLVFSFFAGLRKDLEEEEAYLAYLANLARYFHDRDMQSKWLVAAASCGPLVNYLNTDFPAFAKIILVVIPLVALALPLLNYAECHKQAVSLHQKQGVYLMELRRIWGLASVRTDLTNNDIVTMNKEINSIRENHKECKALRISMPTKSRLMERSVREAKKYDFPSWLHVPIVPRENHRSSAVGNAPPNYQAAGGNSQDF